MRLGRAAGERDAIASDALDELTAHLIEQAAERPAEDRPVVDAVPEKDARQLGLGEERLRHRSVGGADRSAWARAVDRRQLTLEDPEDAAADLVRRRLEHLVAVGEVHVKARLLESGRARDASRGGRGDPVAPEDLDGPIDEPTARELGARLSRQPRRLHGIHR